MKFEMAATGVHPYGFHVNITHWILASRPLAALFSQVDKIILEAAMVCSECFNSELNIIPIREALISE